MPLDKPSGISYAKVADEFWGLSVYSIAESKPTRSDESLSHSISGNLPRLLSSYRLGQVTMPLMHQVYALCLCTS